MQRTKIQWTDTTWNPVVGCTEISDGCRYCYARTMARRIQATGNPEYAQGFHVVRTLPHRLEEPYHWRKPRMVFVCSMSDLFHKDVPTDYILQVFQVMNNTRRHTYQVLTKRDDRLAELASVLSWPPNVWVGVTIESHRYKYRLDSLQQVPARVRFVSFEPLLSPIPLTPRDAWIDWAIVGGESGPKARPMNPDWPRGIRDFCVDHQIPFFFKQWGGRRKEPVAQLDGKIWHEHPPII